MTIRTRWAANGGPSRRAQILTRQRAAGAPFTIAAPASRPGGPPLVFAFGCLVGVLLGAGGLLVAALVMQHAQDQAERIERGEPPSSDWGRE